MSNTTIQLRKSGQTGNTPADLAHGELAINYADGKLFYKNGVGIKSIENQKTFSTINANNSLVIATSPTDILSLEAGSNILLSTNTITKTITISVPGGSSIDTLARDIATNAYNEANTQNVINQTQNTWIADTNTFAQAAYNQANTVPTQLQTRGIRTNASYFPLFIDSNNAVLTAESVYSTGAGITFNPSTNAITATSLTGTLIGSAFGSIGSFSTYVELTGDNDYIEWGASDDVRMMYSGVANTINLQLYSDVISFKVVDNANTADRFIFYKANGDLRLVSGNVIFSDGTVQRTESLTAAQAAFNSANAGVTLATTAYEQANNASGNTVALQAQMTTTNTNIGYTDILANAAYAKANAEGEINNTQNTWIANANTFAQAAFNTANSGVDLATSAYSQANNASSNTVYLQEVNNEQNTNITSVNTFAGSAYNRANNSLNLSTGGVIDGDVVITGNLTITGAEFVTQTTSLAVTDNMIYLNNAIAANVVNAVGNGTHVIYTTGVPHGYQAGFGISVTGVNPNTFNIASSSNTNILSVTSNTFTVLSSVTDTYISGGTARARTASNPDLGFAGGYNDGTYHHAGLFRDASDGTFKFFYNYGPEPDLSPYINTNDPTFLIANLTANLISDVINIRGVDPLTQANVAGEVANAALDLAGSGYGAANTAASNTVYLQTVNDLQNTNIISVNTFAGSAFNSANAGVDLATAAYAQANTVPTQLQTAGIRTNASYYPLLVDSNNATLTTESVYSSGGLVWNPSSNSLVSSGSVIGAAVIATSYLEVSGDGDYIDLGSNNDVRMMYNGTANTMNLQLYSDVISFKIVDDANTADRFIFYKSNGDLRLVSGNIVFSDGTTQGTDALAAAQAAFNAANAGIALATAAYGEANAESQINNTQNTNITAVNTFAQAAFNTANSAGGTATSINTIGVQTNASYFPIFVDANNATATAETLTTHGSLNYNPSTRVFTAGNFGDGTGAYNVNLGSGGTEGRGVVAGYSGGSYGGVGYNIRHTTTGDSYIAPGGDTVSYLRFDSGGFTFRSAGTGAAGRTISFTSTSSLHANGTFAATGNVIGRNAEIGSWPGGSAYHGLFHSRMTGSEYMVISGDSDNNTYLSAFTGGSVIIRGGNNSTTAMITVSTTTTSVTGGLSATGTITSNSDERYKANWRSVTPNFVQKLSLVRSGIYDRTDIEATQAGVSAQSLQEIIPEAVSESEEGKLTVAYGNAALVACVELAKEIVNLKNEIAELRSKLEK